jgi:hypothetical protein
MSNVAGLPAAPHCRPDGLCAVDAQRDGADCGRPVVAALSSAGGGEDPGGASWFMVFVSVLTGIVTPTSAVIFLILSCRPLST